MKVFLKDWSALLRVLQSTGPFPLMKWRGEGWAGRLRARVQVSRYGRWPCNNNMKRRRQKDIIICFRGLEQFNCNCMDNCGQPSSARKKKSILFPLLFGFVTRPAWE